MTDELPKIEIDWLKTVAGALAAVSSAVLLSTLGAAGTIIGAALGSVVITVGSALYSQGLARSRYRIAQAQTTALRKVGIAQAEVRRANRSEGQDEAQSHLEHADERLGEAKGDLEDAVQEPSPVRLRDRLAELPWKRIGLLAAGLFLVAVVAISAFELVAGRTVSSYTGGGDSGGTSLTHLGGGGGSDQHPSQDPGDDSSTSPGQDPTDGTTPSPPSESTDPSDTASPSASPSGSTTPVPTIPTTGSPSLPAGSTAPTPPG
ncbi:MAG: hypothetical protein JWO76_3330 [Nocardioides sp.]|nr:hypothetical protein [Nocardioides sp.]